ncbi:MAG: 2-oxoisovalerate dehydrogenase [Gemmatimonadota bacterium]|nr:2-oxoisovalerate dehydrogenase [Gemmatimonadota bacterium]
MREEITFVVEKDEDSDFLVASWDDPSGNGGIITQGADLKALQEMVGEAVRCHFEQADRPARVRLHFVTDPVLATA